MNARALAAPTPGRKRHLDHQWQAVGHDRGIVVGMDLDQPQAEPLHEFGRNLARLTSHRLGQGRPDNRRPESPRARRDSRRRYPGQVGSGHRKAPVPHDGPRPFPAPYGVRSAVPTTACRHDCNPGKHQGRQGGTEKVFRRQYDKPNPHAPQGRGLPVLRSRPGYCDRIALAANPAKPGLEERPYAKTRHGGRAFGTLAARQV